MKFKLYDILSSIIPGFAVYIALFIYFKIDFNTIPQIPALALVFILGYIINALSSWIEGFLFWTWGGKPSDKMLDGKSILKIKFFQYNKVKNMLSEESESKAPRNDELFSIAMRYANSSNRVTDFNGLYAFSRSILVSTFFSGVILNIHFWFTWMIFIATLCIILIFWIRAKQNAYYYVREVLNTYLSIKTSDESKNKPELLQ